MDNCVNNVYVPKITPLTENFQINMDDFDQHIKLSITATVIFLFIFHIIFRWFYSSEIMVKMLLNITLAASFITIFFFTVGSKIEKNIVETQVNYIVQDLFSGARIIIPDKVLSSLSNEMDVFQKPNLDKEDAQVAQTNKLLMNKAIVIVVCLFMIFLIYAITQYLLSPNSRSEKLRAFGRILLDNFILIIAIGLTEFFFLYAIGQSYRSGDPNKIKLAFIKNLQDIPKYSRG